MKRKRASGIEWRKPRHIRTEKKRKKKITLSQNPKEKKNEISQLQCVLQLKSQVQLLSDQIIISILDWPSCLANIVAGYADKGVLGTSLSQSTNIDFWKYVINELFHHHSWSYANRLDWNAYLIGPKHIFFIKGVRCYPGFLQCIKWEGEWEFEESFPEIPFLAWVPYEDFHIHMLVNLCKKYSLICIPWIVYNENLNGTFYRGRRKVRHNNQCEFLETCFPQWTKHND